MRKLTCIATLAIAVLGLTGCQKEEPSAADKLKEKSAQAAAAREAVGSTSQAAREAAKTRDQDLDLELD